MNSSLSQRLLLLIMFLGAVGLVFGLSGCDRTQAKKGGQKPAEVLVTEAIQKQVTDYEDFTGRLDAYRKVEVQSRVTGYLDKVLFKDGAFVKEGEILFEIDPSTYKADLDRALATLAQSNARYKRLEGDLARSQELLRSKAVSKEDYEKVLG